MAHTANQPAVLVYKLCFSDENLKLLIPQGTFRIGQIYNFCPSPFHNANRNVDEEKRVIKN
jgi:hypothetical protein